MFGFSGVESITKFKLKALKHCLVQPCFILACKTMAAGMQQSVVLYKTWIVMQQKAMQYIKLNKMSRLIRSISELIDITGLQHVGNGDCGPCELSCSSSQIQNIYFNSKTSFLQ